MTSIQLPLLYTKEQAAERLGGIVTPYWLRINAAARRIPCTYVGKRLCFSEKNLADLVEGVRPDAEDGAVALHEITSARWLQCRSLHRVRSGIPRAATGRTGPRSGRR